MTVVFALCLLAFCKASVSENPWFSYGFLWFWFDKGDANGDGLISAGEFTDWKLQMKDCHGLQKVLLYIRTHLFILGDNKLKQENMGYADMLQLQ